MFLTGKMRTDILIPRRAVVALENHAQHVGSIKDHKISLTRLDDY